MTAPTHSNSGPDRKRHLPVSVPPTTPRAGDANLSLRVHRNETRPASYPVQPAGRPVMLQGGRNA